MANSMPKDAGEDPQQKGQPQTLDQQWIIDCHPAPLRHLEQPVDEAGQDRDENQDHDPLDDDVLKMSKLMRASAGRGGPASPAWRSRAARRA